ncbi:helix-turn-helix domain-containing protein [Bradyrhizobium sp. Ai1a-2]|uniref:helix-turn-helix domain-containing protein n=1 Tax=Bradyrhizobium sp. Ai1a-2 TaxID=196490 RepID=UPI000481D4DA|nr:helix-turn-helix domain-containing protein [Bradyrhizobium sp. Ai1a-2]
MTLVERRAFMRAPGVSPSSVHEERRHLSPAYARKLIADVCKELWLHRDDVLGGSRQLHLVEARVKIAERMLAEGMSVAAIARALHRTHTTVLNYLPQTRMRKLGQNNEMRILRKMTPDVAALVRRIAQAEKVSVDALIARWVAERAKIEERHGP